MFINGYWTEYVSPKGLTSGGGEKNKRIYGETIRKRLTGDAQSQCKTNSYLDTFCKTMYSFIWEDHLKWFQDLKQINLGESFKN